MYSYKISRSVFPLYTDIYTHTQGDDERPRVIRGELLVRRRCSTSRLAIPFFADTAIFGGNKDSMRNGRVLRALPRAHQVL